MIIRGDDGTRSTSYYMVSHLPMRQLLCLQHSSMSDASACRYMTAPDVHRQRPLSVPRRCHRTVMHRVSEI
eukprot:6194036-Pleurochrysis_carterae.AAC.1